MSDNIVELRKLIVKEHISIPSSVYLKFSDMLHDHNDHILINMRRYSGIMLTEIIGYRQCRLQHNSSVSDRIFCIRPLFTWIAKCLRP
jgi:hypothetical protein